MASILRAIPFLVFPIILYAAVAFFLDHASVRASLNEPFFGFTLPSGAPFVITRGYGFVMLAALLLFIEIIKSTRATASTMVENSLAFIVFIVAFILFLLHQSFGTIEFALIMVMTLIDFMAGFIVMAMTARRDTAIH
ncbi:MAG: hypothetical protein AB7P07_15150 [Hyphomonadaceae bacterium]